MPLQYPTKIHIFIAYDVAQSIRLTEVEELYSNNLTRGSLIPTQRSPSYYGFSSVPLRIELGRNVLRLLAEEREVQVNATLYDFGAISISYTLVIDADLQKIERISEELYENENFVAHSKTELERIVSRIDQSLVKKQVSNLIEDYHIFHIENIQNLQNISGFIAEHQSIITSILRGDRTGLSSQERDDALSRYISYQDHDVLLLDWHAALVLNYSGDDVKQVIEFANIALLEMRFLDQQLDQALDASYDVLHKGMKGFFRSTLFNLKSVEKNLKKIGEHQVDAALLYESINNGFKLLGDQYLTKVYKLATDRFSLDEWQRSIEKKIETLQSIYEKVNDQISHKRMEAMEIAIIVLFLFSISLEIVALLKH